MSLDDCFPLPRGRQCLRLAHYGLRALAGSGNGRGQAKGNNGSLIRLHEAISGFCDPGLFTPRARRGPGKHQVAQSKS